MCKKNFFENFVGNEYFLKGAGEKVGRGRNDNISDHLEKIIFC